MEAIIDYRGKTPPKSKAGIPLISAANVKAGRVKLDDPEFISLVDYKTWARRGFTQPGDVLITTEAPAGEVAPYPRRGTYQISRRVMALRPDPTRLDSDFLLYALLWREVNQRLLSFSRGTTVPRVLKTDVTSLSIPCPPLAEQKSIANILGALDAKIELNRRMNETLEATARAIFKSWFVDFDPVRAKMDGRQPAGMSAEVAGLFPDGFEHVEGMLIPQGWSINKLGDVIRINERSIRKGEVAGEIQYTDISSVSVGHCDVPAVMDFAEAPSRARRKARHGDTLWSCVRPNRRSFCYVHSPPDNLLVSTGFAVLTPGTLTSNYLYQLTTTQEFTDYLTSNADGSAYPAVRSDHFAIADVLVPAGDVLAAFEERAVPMRDMIAKNNSESTTLADLRDTLLPKLLSGEVRVGDAERAVEEVA